MLIYMTIQNVWIFRVSFFSNNKTTVKNEKSSCFVIWKRGLPQKCVCFVLLYSVSIPYNCLCIWISIVQKQNIDPFFSFSFSFQIIAALLVLVRVLLYKSDKTVMSINRPEQPCCIHVFLFQVVTKQHNSSI